MSNRKPILKLGVTGGIGSGKSSVCQEFERLGVPVLYADTLAKELSTHDSRISKKIRILLGEEAYTADSVLNRQYIAQKIFSDSRLQKQIEALVHPQVERAIDRRIMELQRAGHTLVIVEAALLYEAGLDQKMDAVLVVEADEAARIQRVQKRDSSTVDAVRARMAAQAGTKPKAAKADYVFYNNGTLQELQTKTQFLFSVFSHIVNEDERGKKTNSEKENP